MKNYSNREFAIAFENLVNTCDWILVDHSESLQRVTCLCDREVYTNRGVFIRDAIVDLEEALRKARR